MMHRHFIKTTISASGILLFNMLMLNVTMSWSMQEVFFSNLTTRNGLGSNITNSVVQDSQGFIWIGTQEGLCRYDGFKMMIFQNENSSGSLSSNNISTLLYDEGHLWVGTWDGLNRINIKTLAVERISTGGARVIRALYSDRQGRIWIGTSDGLLIYDKTSGGYQHYNTLNSNLSHNTIRAIYQSGNDEVWIGTYDGLNRYSDSQFTSYDLKGSYKPFLENNLIVSIEPYKPTVDSLLWVGTETGLVLFNTSTAEYLSYNATNTSLSNEVIKCIHHQNDSILWLGTDFGLNIFNTLTGSVETFYHDPLINHTIASNVIWQIYQDKQKRLWLITSNGVSITDNRAGFYTFHEQYFSAGNPRIGNQVKDILVSSSGDIWMATIHGVIRKDPLTGTETTYSSSSPPHKRILLNNVYALKEDEHGRIWIGTAGGINIWDESQGRMHSITANRENGLLSNYISGFTSDCDGNLWVTAWEGGLFRIDWSGSNTSSMKFELVDPNGDGRLVATPGDMFYGINNRFWKINSNSLRKTPVEAVNNMLLNKQVSSLLSAKDGTVWTGTLQGLIRYFPTSDSIVKISIHTGRPQKIINLQEDRQGNIWATTTDAIIKYDVASQEQILIPIDRNSPMKGFYHYCSDITHDGMILFGGDNGFIMINPATARTYGEAPGIFISGLLVNNQQITPSDSIKVLQKDIAFAERLDLKHSQNSVTFEFTTLDYLYPGFVQFQYRMLPGNDQWVLTSGEKNFAVFANLKPGDYTLEVMGSDRYGAWSDIRSLHISISPSIWLSRSFLLLYLIIIVSASWYSYRVYYNRRRLRNELQVIRLEKQHSEALHQAKIRFFTNISHEFRTPLSLIIPPLQQMLKGNTHNNEKLLRLANSNAQRLYKLVNQLLDFRKIEANKLELATSSVEIVSFCKAIFHSFDDMASRHESDYTFSSNTGQLFIEADQEKIETIIFNLLSNAFKYTPAYGSISLKISHAKKDEGPGCIHICVKDSGIGISEEEQLHIFEQFYQTTESKSLKKGSGIGLTLAQEYARLHNGRIEVSSSPGQGSEFIFSFPVVPAGTTAVEKIMPLKPAVLNTQNVKPAVSGKKILVVDDNEDILQFIEMNLIDHYQVYPAKNGIEGLEMLQKIHPHLVISDVMMPVMDGIELCEQIKNNKTTMHIPVILLTARATDMHKTEGVNKGADLYITKPFDMDYLRSCIAGVFRRDSHLSDYIKTQLIINPSQGHEPALNQDEVFLKKVMGIIENNISNTEFSVAKLSREMGMSSTHLYRKVRESTGYSTKELIMDYRMQKAVKMIANNEANISEVMYSVGFSSLSGFSRSFKAKFGVSPTSYSAKAEKNNTHKAAAS